MPIRRIKPGRLRRWLSGRLDTAGLLGLHAEARLDLTWQAYRHLDSGQPTEALRIYDLIRLIWPTETLTTVIVGQGASRQLMGDLDAAIALYDEALAIDPDCPYALANRAECRLLLSQTLAADTDLAAAWASLDRRTSPTDDPLRRRVEALRGIARTDA